MNAGPRCLTIDQPVEFEGFSFAALPTPAVYNQRLHNRSFRLINPSQPGIAGPALDTAVSTLLTPYNLDAGALSGIIDAMHTHQVDHADLYFQYARSEGWSLEEGIVKSGNFHIEEGV